MITRNEDITLHMHVIKMKNTTEKTMSSTVKQKKNKLRLRKADEMLEQEIKK